MAFCTLRKAPNILPKGHGMWVSPCQKGYQDEMDSNPGIKSRMENVEMGSCAISSLKLGRNKGQEEAITGRLANRRTTHTKMGAGGESSKGWDSEGHWGFIQDTMRIQGREGWEGRKTSQQRCMSGLAREERAHRNPGQHH